MGFAIMVHADKCTGCRMCEIACSLRNMHECNPERSRIRVVSTAENGQYRFIPSTCMQCETAMCELVCPTGAMGRDPATGARRVDTDTCIGCSACSFACPFGACFVDRRLGVSVVCHQCDGDPTCVTVCPSDALEYTRADTSNIALKRAGADRLMAAMDKLIPSTPPDASPPDAGLC